MPTSPATPEGRVNVTDPDSQVVKGLRGFLQGDNAQAVTNEHQVVLAAEIETVGADFGHLEPMLDAAHRELRAAGVNDTPEVPAAAEPPGATGTAAATAKCVKSWPPNAAASSTASANR